MKDATVPLTVYETPNPEHNVSPLYTVYCERMEDFTDPARCWIVKERYGAWDEKEIDPTKKKFKIDVTTLSPNEPQHYLTLDEAHEQAEKQMMLRVRSGFCYLFVRDFYEAPWHKIFKVSPDGRRVEIPVRK
ncbi:MAG: hypothetical protein LAN59_08760 [Acidobacteriia bacterium]|nr:hypothetical protein [Terriglobia bacterium]